MWRRNLSAQHCPCRCLLVLVEQALSLHETGTGGKSLAGQEILHSTRQSHGEFIPEGRTTLLQLLGVKGHTSLSILSVHTGDKRDTKMSPGGALSWGQSCTMGLDSTVRQGLRVINIPGALWILSSDRFSQAFRNPAQYGSRVLKIESLSSSNRLGGGAGTSCWRACSAARTALPSFSASTTT